MSKKTFTTAVGLAIYPHLTTPDTKFNKDGVYELSLRVTDKELADLQALVAGEIDRQTTALASVHKFDPKTVKRAPETPWRPALDKDKKSVPGMVDVRFRHARLVGSSEKQWEFHPALFGPDAKEWDLKTAIWTGSKVRVSFAPVAWYARGQLGVSFRLEGVQVIELVTGGRTAEAMGFAPVDQPMDQDTFMQELKNMSSGRP